ncbi:MAG: DUF6498-containing protein [Bdellovibrionota bacterium]
MIDFIAALVSIACAYVWDWSPSELIWGFWLMSLTRGWVLVPASFFLELPKTWQKRDSGFQIFRAGLLTAIEAIGFFFILFHFTAFHFIQSAFLQHYYPQAELSPNFGPADLLLVYRAVVAKMWPLAILSAISTIGVVRELHESRQRLHPVKGVYSSVVKIHFLLFAISLMAQAEVPMFRLYLMISVVFLPYGELWEWWKKRRTWQPGP